MFGGILTSFSHTIYIPFMYRIMDTLYYAMWHGVSMIEETLTAAQFYTYYVQTQYTLDVHISVTRML